MIERATIKDIEAVHSVLRHPDIFPLISDDTVNTPEKLDMTEALENEAVYVLYDIGCVILLVPISNVIYDTHVNFLPGFRGEYAIERSSEGYRIMFEQTPCESMIAWIPTKFPNVRNFAYIMGFKYVGIQENSIRKNGHPQNQWIVAFNKEDWLKWEQR